MSNTVTITCQLDTTDPTAKLGFEIWVDDQKFFDADHVAQPEQIQFEIPEDEAEHELRFVLKNKTSEHTQLDADGNITSDARLLLSNLAFDGIALGNVLSDLAVYTHDFNGSGSSTQQKFYSELGCNGVVTLKFATPVYMWLLEHM